MIEEMSSDIASGHNIIATVYVDCRSMYRANGPEALPPRRRGRVRQWRRGDERERRLRPGRDLRRHRQPRQPAAGRRREARAGSRDRRRQWPLPRHPAFLGVGCRSQRRRHVCDATEGPAARSDLPQGLSPASRRSICSFDAWLFHPQIGELTDLARAFPDTKIVLDHCGGPIGIGSYAGKREEIFPVWKASIQEIAKCPKRGGQARRARDVPARL